MEEKVLIKSEQYNVRKIFNAILIGGAGICVLAMLLLFSRWFWDNWLTMSLPVVLIIASAVYFWLRSYELTVTNKRIYGKIAWGKRVDLPVDSVSATAMVPLFKGVSVSTSSGKISFLVIKNADEIYTVMNNLLIERQQEKEKPTATTIISQQSDEADQLKKYKDLLDGGVISQEEFDAKKKQLLGL